MDNSERLHLGLWPIREKITAATDNQAKQVIRNHFVPMRRSYLKEIQKAGHVKMMFFGMKYPHQHDPVSLCALYLDEELTLPLLQRAKKAALRHRRTEFTLWYDTADAVTDLVLKISLARNCPIDIIVSEGEQDFQNLTGHPLPVTDSVDIFLQFNRKAQTASRSLATDPTGFSLVDEYVHEAKELLRYPESLTPTVTYFRLVGAVLAKQSYKLLYPMASSLLKKT